MVLSDKVKNVLKWSLLVLGIALLVIGAGILMIIPTYVARKIAEEDYLGRDKNGTYNLMLEKFRAPKYDIQLQIWTYSVLNTDEIIHKSGKPKVVEKGPYTFVETQEKRWMEFAQNDTRLLYRNFRTYEFSNSLSCPNCALTDKVTVPNVVFQKLVDIAMQNEAQRFAIQEAIKIKGESAFIEVTVGGLLFDGYKDPLVSAICDHDILLRTICHAFGVPDKIGLLYGQNNTHDGTYEINTGLVSRNDLGHVYSWNEMAKLTSKYWYGNGARMLNGTDGQVFPPNLILSDNLHVFVGQICRTAEMEYTDVVNIQGIPSYRYVPAASMNDVAIQRSMGFCNPHTPVYFNDTSVQQEKCSPAGLLDLSSCVPGNPRIYASQSHFLNSPNALVNSVVGMAQPSLITDQTFLDLEPLSGVIVNAERRSQLNVGVLNGKLKPFVNMSNLIVPIIWMNETARIDPDTRDQVMQAVSALHYSFIGGLAMIVIGIFSILFFAGIVIYTRFIQRRPQNIYDPLVDDDERVEVTTRQLSNIEEEESHATAPQPQQA